jgi:N utilization substance protein B
MLNRRILRIKAFKAFYTSTLTKGTEKPMTLADAEYLLDVSCESTRDLYLFMLGIVSPLTKIAQERIAAVQKKRVLTEEEKNPNMKFAQNALAKYLDSDRTSRSFSRRRILIGLRTI